VSNASRKPPTVKGALGRYFSFLSNADLEKEVMVVKEAIERYLPAEYWLVRDVQRYVAPGAKHENGVTLCCLDMPDATVWTDMAQFWPDWAKTRSDPATEGKKVTWSCQSILLEAGAQYPVEFQRPCWFRCKNGALHMQGSSWAGVNKKGEDDTEYHTMGELGDKCGSVMYENGCKGLVRVMAGKGAVFQMAWVRYAADDEREERLQSEAKEMNLVGDRVGAKS
jgi:hypothetical protein